MKAFYLFSNIIFIFRFLWSGRHWICQKRIIYQCSSFWC